MHTLLPMKLQTTLKFAAKTSQLDAAIRMVQEERPDLFHTETSIKDRVFYDEPRGAYTGSYINPAPPRI
jgi:hypothetical protein